MRLAIVHGNNSVLEYLLHILSEEADIFLVGAFRSGKEALRGLKRASPEVVLTDLELPDMPASAFIKTAKNRVSGIDILIYTNIDDRERVLSAFQAGATGYLLKGTRPKELIEAITALYGGGAPMSPKIARMMVLELHATRGAARQRSIAENQAACERHLPPHSDQAG